MRDALERWVGHCSGWVAGGSDTFSVRWQGEEKGFPVYVLYVPEGPLWDSLPHGLSIKGAKYTDQGFS